MPDLANDPERFTLRHADATREGHAQLTEEFGLVTEQATRLPMRKDSPSTALLISLIAAAPVIIWFEAFGGIACEPTPSDRPCSDRS